MTISQEAVAQVSHTAEDLTTALEVLRQKMIANYKASGFKVDYDIEFEFGTKYVRIVHIRAGGQRSCAGWVVCDTKHKKFLFGDLLKSAGWKAPETNFKRGSVFELDGKQIQWTGIQ